MTDKTYIGVNVDLSQAESRVVDHILHWLTRKEYYQWRARVRPADYDQHTARAAAIFAKPPEEVTKTERYLGKKTVHAYQRGMGAETLQGSLLKDGFVKTKGECATLLSGVDVAEPDLKSVYFPWVREQIIVHREVRNSWGRRLPFTYDRFDDALYRRGYSFYPQSEVIDWMNMKGLVPFFEGTIAQRSCAEVLLHVHCHDSLFYSAVPEVAYDVTALLVHSLEQERYMYNEMLAIPCEVEIGRSWKAERSWKQLPRRDEFESAIEEVLCVATG